mmetsp:Transcript_24122/g.50507  ORF Transcript_24122/g.50507 Transcript_24122/m.50507 type:complete len:264 (-) Transcript_24122:64-855(-)
MRERKKNQARHLYINLGKAIDSGSLLLHTPSLGSTVLSSRNIVRNRPDRSRLSHVETTHGLNIRRKLIGIEDSSTSHQTRVSVLLQPLGSKRCALSSKNTNLGTSCLLDGLQFLCLSRRVVRRGRETEGFPDGVHTGRAEVGLTDDGKVDIESGKTEEGLTLGSLFRGLVHFVSEALFAEGPFETDFGDALSAVTDPGIFEAVGGSLQEAEVLHLHVVRSHMGAGGAGHILLSKRAKGRSVDRVGRCTTGGSKNKGGGDLHGG